jgi:signal transduction histidine kinase
MDTRAHRFVDGALAVGSGTALIVEGILKAHDGLPVIAYPLAAATAAPLALRRRAPLAALFAVEAGAIACVALFDAGATAVVPVMVALFAVALLGDRKRSLVAGAISGTALVATMLLLEGFEFTSAALRLLLLLAALVAGDTVRSRLTLRAVALEQALREEREREEANRQRLVDERLRIARDLHDTLAHALVAINVRAGVAAHLRHVQDPIPSLLDIKEVSANALRDLRVTLRLLREQDEAVPVVPALDLGSLPGLIERARAGGLDTHADIEVDGEVIPSPVGQAAFRIVQEALTNVLRHARASSAHVVVEVSRGALHIGVTDDGLGGTGANSGHGLRGMAERAAALGGRVVTGPRAGGGWQVQAHLPLSRTETP